MHAVATIWLTIALDRLRGALGISLRITILIVGFTQHTLNKVVPPSRYRKNDTDQVALEDESKNQQQKRPMLFFFKLDFYHFEKNKPI